MSILKELLETLVKFSKAIFWSIYYTVISPPEKSVQDEVVLITGAGSGIGRLMALQFAQRGATLVLWDINKTGIEETAQKIKSLGGKKAYTYVCDVSNRSEVENFCDKVRTDVGRDVDILINNAGIVTGQTLLDSPDEKIIKCIQVNLLAHFWTVKGFLPAMMNRNHGHIVTIASMAGILGTVKLVDYCASKFGNVGMAEALDYEITAAEKTGVHTTTVCPYFINTGMFDGCKGRFPWMMPPMEPEYAVNKMMHAILINQKIIYLPKTMYLMGFLKSILPVEASAILHKFFGAANFMDNFVGRQKKE